MLKLSLRLHILFAALIICMPTQAIAQRPPMGMGGGVPVVVTPVVENQWVEEIEALGTLRAREQVKLTATVSDKVSAIHFTDGQWVEKGAIVVEMDSGEEKAELEAALSALREAKKQHQRSRKLVKKGATSQSVADEHRRVFEISKAQVGVAKAKLQDHVIHAPFSGVLGLREVSPGAYLNSGDTITTLTDASTMRLDFTLPEVHLASLTVGQTVKVITKAYDGRIFQGQISAVDNHVDNVTRAIGVRALLSNEENLLKAGMLMTVNIKKAAEPVLVLPEGSLVPESASNFVYVVDPTAKPAVAVKTEVKIGRRQAGIVEILSGVNVGQMVVSHGTLKLANGRPVMIIATQEQGVSMADILEKMNKASQSRAHK